MPIGHTKVEEKFLKACVTELMKRRQKLIMADSAETGPRLYNPENESRRESINRGLETIFPYSLLGITFVLRKADNAFRTAETR